MLEATAPALVLAVRGQAYEGRAGSAALDAQGVRRIRLPAGVPSVAETAVRQGYYLGTLPLTAVHGAIREVLVTEEASPAWSRRAVDEIREARADLPWLSASETTLVVSGDSAAWYTFAGVRANATLAVSMAAAISSRPSRDRPLNPFMIRRELPASSSRRSALHGLA